MTSDRWADLEPREHFVLLAHGWSVQSATAYGFLPEAS